MSISYRDQLIQIKDKYRAAGEEWPATNRMIATWAVRHRHYEMPATTTIAACAADLSKAFSSSTRKNSQGQSVRTMAAAQRQTVDSEGEPRQLWFWDDVDTASHEHMAESFLARRRQARGDIRSLQSDVADYNKNHLNNGNRPIVMTFDFELLDEDEAVEEAVACQ